MDEQLKAYAQERRAQAGSAFELHPATRNLLQGEAARTVGQPSGRLNREREAVPFFWRRLVLGGACTALLFVGAGLWLRFDAERELNLTRQRDSNLWFFAQNTVQPESKPAESNELRKRVETFQLSGAPERQLARTTAETLRREETPNPARPAESLAPDGPRLDLALATTPPAQEADLASNAPRYQFGLHPSAEKDARLGRDNAAAAGAAAAPEPTAPIYANVTADANPSANTASDLELKAASAPRVAAPMVDSLPVAAQSANGIYFKQVDPRARLRKNLNSPPLPKVLNTFELQQNDQTVNLIDADGSVYQGAILSTLSNQASPGFKFNAAGTNRTLNKAVMFTGEFSAPAEAGGSQAPAQGLALAERSVKQTSPPATLRTEDTVALKQQFRSQAPQINPGVTAARIQGEATVGGKDQFRIEARQVAP
jgi:hypothetical protein